jgi:hypothetical protein
MDNVPFWQTSPFWAGIVISALLSLPISIAANACYYRLVTYLDNRKITSQTKSRKKALDQYNVITEIHTGRRDRYSYLLRVAIEAIITFQLTLTTLGTVTVLLALIPAKERFSLSDSHQVFVTFLPPVLLVGCSFSLIVAYLSFRNFYEVYKRFGQV